MDRNENVRSIQGGAEWKKYLHHNHNNENSFQNSGQMKNLILGANKLKAI